MALSIRSRLLLLVLSVLVPAVLAAAWLIARTYSAERDALERNLRDTTRALSQVVDGELTQRALMARMLTRLRPLDAPELITPERLHVFESQARSALAGMDGWIELASAGQTLLDTRWPPGSEARPRPADAALLRQPAIGNLQEGPPAAPLHAPVVAPMIRGGRTLLNLTVTILPSELQRIVDRQALPQGWVGTVIDGRGRIVAQRPAPSPALGANAAPELLALMAQQREGLFKTSALDRQPGLGYFSTSPQGWTYVTEMPRSGLTFGLPPAVRQLAVGALLLLTAAVAGALLVARRIVAPVNALRDAAVEMRAGRPVQPRPTGIRECDAVSGALAEAARTIQASQSELQRQVAEAVQQERAAEQQVSRGQRVEALGRLTGGVAHDFNNLLGVIGNSAHLMQRHAAQHPELKMPLAAMMRSVEAGSRLTQHLLRVAGRHPNRPARVDLARYLPELQELLRLVLGKRIDLDVRVAPGTRPLTVDASELELVLINLAVNSRDALPQGGRVWIEAGPADAADCADLPAGDYVTLSFNDDGHGIDEETLQRVFEPFFTTKAFGQGSGLGLSQVQGFATQAGGRARLASTPGLGTCVMLLLPAGADAAATVPEAEPGPAPADLRLQGRHVLLVEDNEELAAVTAALLGTSGCRVERATSSSQALALLARSDPFDVVLSDVVMPGELDGIALARRLQRERPRLPVVLLSGYSNALAGQDDLHLLRKPCPPDRLVDALASAIAAH
jgi:signal transduction histidine kinase